MPQQLYLWRLATCVAVQLSTKQQLERVQRDGNVKNAATADVGDFLVLYGDATAEMIAPDRFAQEWARPSTLLEPHHADLVQGIRELETQQLEELLEKSEQTAERLGRQVMELSAELNQHQQPAKPAPMPGIPREPTAADLEAWKCSNCGHKYWGHSELHGCFVARCECDKDRDVLLAEWKASHMVA